MFNSGHKFTLIHLGQAHHGGFFLAVFTKNKCPAAAQNGQKDGLGGHRDRLPRDRCHSQRKALPKQKHLKKAGKETFSSKKCEKGKVF